MRSLTLKEFVPTVMLMDVPHAQLDLLRIVINALIHQLICSLENVFVREV